MKYRNALGWRNRLARVVWRAAWLILFRPTPVFMHFWRRWLLKRFGATVGAGAHPYPSCYVWAPWNLHLGSNSCLGSHVDCYSVAMIEIGDGTVVSQGTYLCAATHNYNDPAFPLVAAPIHIGARVWVAAGAFIGPGVTVGEGAVVGARAVVVKDVPAWVIVAGNPARPIKARVLACQ